MRLALRILTSAALVVAAGGCSSHPAHHHAAQPDIAPLVLDDGALTITPASGSPHITHAFAARVLAGQELAVDQRAMSVSLASVTVSKSLLPVPSCVVPCFTPKDEHIPLAWVYVGHQHPGGMACSGVGFQRPLPTPSPAISHPSGDWVVIVDANNGTADVYRGVGTGFCFPSTVPAIAVANIVYSVPFSDDHLGPLLVRQTVRIPPCGRLFGGSFANGHGTSIRGATVAALVPTVPCAGRSSVRVMTLNGRIHDQPHGKLGIECWGNYDAALGPPADCVSPT